MTPLQIEILIFYYCRSGVFGQFENRSDAPAVLSQTSELVGFGLIEPDPDQFLGYRATPAGRQHVTNLCSLPSPDISRRAQAFKNREAAHNAHLHQMLEHPPEEGLLDVLRRIEGLLQGIVLDRLSK